MSGICVHMNGAKCALEYCDYYNGASQKCTLALESKMKVELLSARIKEAREKASKEKKLKSAKGYMAERNIVKQVKTLQ